MNDCVFPAMQSITNTALKYFKDTYGVEGMLTEVGYNAELDVDGDGIDDEDSYLDNYFIVRCKTEGFQEKTPVGKHLPVDGDSHKLHVAAADGNTKVSGCCYWYQDDFVCSG